MISDLYFTQAGRLYQRDSFFNPSHFGSLSDRVSQQPENPNLSDYWTDMLCEREKHTSAYKDMIDWVTGPDDDSDTPHEHEYLSMRSEVPDIRHVNRVVPACEIFRFRTAPFRLEPEWQLDDADVLHASAKVDVARVRGLGIESAGEIIELIRSFGRWPGIGTDAHTRVGRTEARLANVVQAWFTLCAVRLSEFPQTVILAPQPPQGKSCQSIRGAETHTVELGCCVGKIDIVCYVIISNIRERKIISVIVIIN